MDHSKALREYCLSIRTIVSDPQHQPETSLYPPLGRLLEQVLPDLAGQHAVNVMHQASAEVGAPDFKVAFPNMPPLGFVEAKPIDHDLRPSTEHDKRQFERYSDLPNWIYTNYWTLRLYAGRKLLAEAALVPKHGLDPGVKLDAILRDHDCTPAVELLRRFALAQLPQLTNADLVAQWLAHAARLVRGAVADSLELPAERIKPLIDVREEFAEILFPKDDEDEESFDKIFSDAYAQTLAYGLLLARVESQAELNVHTVAQHIDKEHHPLLRATVRLLAEDEILDLVGWSIELLVDVVNSVTPHVLDRRGGRDPVLYFYEDFLEAYDPELREKRGVYFTPPSVVKFQVRAIHQLLKEHFDAPEGLLNDNVRILDPAAGTGTYLIACLEQAAAEAEAIWGPASVPEAVSKMLGRLAGFELLVGPYAVSHYRLQAAASALGADVSERLNVFLTDTLAPAHAKPDHAPRFAYLSQPLTEERSGADRIKSEAPILVILGNPPYDRTTALKNQWVYKTLLDDFRKPVQEAGLGVHLKSLSDPVAYFYRWALWKLFESDGAQHRGILSFITNRSWIRGEAFGGLRQMIRERFDEGFILDLHGDSRAALPAGVKEDKNVFDIKTGVAIGTFYRAAKEKSGTPFGMRRHSAIARRRKLYLTNRCDN